MNTAWYTIDNVSVLDSPALVIYPERVKHNIALAIQMTGDVNRLRPHVKTHKSPDATKLMIASGISQFKCATIAEAEMLGTCQAKDVLLAYQPIGPKLHRFVQVMQPYPSTRYSCLIDNADAARAMAAFFASAGRSVPVFVDLNVGQNRTGIEPGAAAALYAAASGLKGITAVGLHAYDGHIRQVDLSARKKECDDCYEKVLQVKKEIMQKGFAEPMIIAGGSPTFSIHCQRQDCQCSPGTFIYWDKGYSDLCPEQGFLPAALVVTRIISLPARNRICLDLGHKSIAAENELTKRVHFLHAPEWTAVSQSEEHLVLETHKDHPQHTGEVFYGMPVHVCPTIALYERAYIVEANQVTGEWENTARDRKINY